MTCVSYPKDGRHMVPAKGAPMQIKWLKSCTNKHLAICYTGPFKFVSNKNVCSAGNVKFNEYKRAVHAFFKKIGGTDPEYSAREDGNTMMTCFYMRVAVEEMPSDEELQALVESLTKDFADAIPDYLE